MEIFKKVFSNSLSLLKSKTGKKLIAAWAISFLLFAAAPVQAAEYQAGSYDQFKAALANPALTNGDTIVLTSDIVFGQSATSLILPAGITQLTIQSAATGNYEIKGNGSIRLFEIQSGANATLTLKNVVFATGNFNEFSPDGGGAVFAPGSITLIGEGANTFKNNQSAFAGGAVSTRGNVHIAGGVNTFEANKAIDSGMGANGGAIYSQAEALISGGTNVFSSNEAASGSAIYAKDIKITGGENSFVNNQGAGGSNQSGVIVAEGTVTIAGGKNTLSNNNDTGIKAQTVAITGGETTIGNSTGSAIAGAQIKITGGTNNFIDNKSKSGQSGGALSASLKVEIAGGKNTLAGNETGNEGGAIATQEVVISGGETIFKENKALGGGSFGGAISVGNSFQNGSLKITGGQNTFENNATANFGGAVNANGNIELFGGVNAFRGNTATNSTSAGSTGGGAIVATVGNKIIISGGTNIFENNRAAADSNDGTATGGALAAGTVEISGGKNTFTNNQANAADALGGAVAARDAVKITGGDNLFGGNKANGQTFKGGAIYSGGDVVLAGNSKNAFTANEVTGSLASSFGGAVYASGQVILAGNSQNTFDGNKGTEYNNGGAIYAEDSVILTENSVNIFKNNEGGRYGGAIYSKKDVNISGGTNIFSQNKAAYGGAIYVDNGDVNFSGGSQNIFLDNESPAGSSIYAAGALTVNSSLSGAKTLLGGNGEFRANSFTLTNTIIAPKGDMTFRHITGAAPISLENMTLRGEAGGSLAASGPGDYFEIIGTLTADITKESTTRLGGTVKAKGSSDKLVKEGLGELRIIGDSHEYNAEINQGSFMLGEIGATGKLTGNLEVRGAKFGGNGTIAGNVNMYQNSVLSPGNSVGTINITGNLNLNGTVVEVEIVGNNNDKINVGGSAVLDNTVKFNIVGYKFTGDYEFLTAAGGISANDIVYDFLDNNLLYVVTSLSGNDTKLSLKVYRNPNALIDAAKTPNQKAVALMAMTDDNDMVYLIFNNPNDVVKVLNQTGGEIHPSTQAALTESTRHIRKAVLSRMSETGSDNNIWAQVVGSWDSYNSDAASKMKAQTQGVIAGFDKNNGSRRTGVALGITKNKNRLDDIGASSNADSTHLALYTGSADYSKPYQTRFGAGMSWHRVDSSRNISASKEILSADYSARTFQMFGEIGKRQTRGGQGYIEPFLGLAYTSTNFGGFSERSNIAAGGALRVDGKTHNTTYSNLGVRILSANGGKTTLKAAASWQHILGGDKFKTNHRLLAGVTPFEIEGAPIAKDAFVLDLGFDYQESPKFSWGVNYSGQLAKQMHNNAVMLNFKWKY